MNIENKEYKPGQVINQVFGNKKIIATVFSKSKTKVIKELKEYEYKGYDFAYFSVNGNHTVRVIKTINI